MQLVPPEGLLLKFVLGLRHGLDPDHIAIVDPIAYGRSGQARRGGDGSGNRHAGLAPCFTAGMIVVDSLDG